MNRTWLQDLICKVFLEKTLWNKYRPGRRSRTRLRFESLEERSIPSITSIDPLAMSAFLSSLSETNAALSSELLPYSSNNSLGSTELDSAGLERVLEDLQKLETTTSGSLTTAMSSQLQALTYQFESDIPAQAAMSTSASSSVVFASDATQPLSVPQTATASPPNSAPQPASVTANAPESETLTDRPAPPAHTTTAGQAETSVPAPTQQFVSAAFPTGTGNLNSQTTSVTAVVTAANPSPMPQARAAEPTSISLSEPERAEAKEADTVGWTSGIAVQIPRSVETYRPEAPSAAKQSLAELPDGTLLRRFAQDHEQAAFTELVQRHERIVLNVSTRVLGDAHRAQDVFQATFLILARRAAVLDTRIPLAGWLYKVAYHLALRYRAADERKRRLERSAVDRRVLQDGSDLFTPIEKEELLQAIGEEIQGLPEKYRVPLMMCYFEGRTHTEAAKAIGLPRGSVAKRIGDALGLLRGRLLNRGLAHSTFLGS